jgi:hypothetical protein
MKRTFYEMIGVAHDADQAIIDAAYTQVMGRLNEDIKRGANDATMEAQLVRDGYQILSDPAKRKRYDAKLSAEASGVHLVFYPDNKHEQRKLGVQSLVFALLATTFCGVVYWQMNRKISEVRADYETVVVRKQAAQNAPKVIDSPPPDQGAPTVVGTVRSEPVIKGAPAEEKK